jgi:hypothetical protein
MSYAMTAAHPSASRRSPGEHPHSDRRNFTAGDYLQMCLDGEAVFSESEYARLAGVSRAEIWRWKFLARVPEEMFEQALKAMAADNRPWSTTRLVDELKRRTGMARLYVETCPHCGGVVRQRRR